MRASRSAVPTKTHFTAAVLAQADPVYAEELKRQLDTSGAARVWVPPAAPLADAVGARRRPARGADAAGADRRGRRSRRRRRLRRRRPRRRRDRRRAGRAAGVGALRSRATVAVLNRGVPGFAVESDGTLHTSLMRSCTGWPSGTWIDPPRRTAPDGSNFQLQHWTHTFDYARGLRRRRLATTPTSPPAAPNSRIRCWRSPDNAGQQADCPAWGSLLEVEPAGKVALGALKAAGNPLRRGQRPALSTPPTGVALRLVETCGAHHRGRGPLRAACAPPRPRALDLLEQPRSQGLAAEHATLHGYRDRHRADAAQHAAGCSTPTTTVLAPEAEAAQPLYARYWLHNRGPAPLGGLPRGGAPASAATWPCRAEFAEFASAHRGQRQHRRRAARQGAAAVPGRLDAPTRPSCRSCCRPASTWRPTSR